MLLTLHAATWFLALSACLVFFVQCVCVIEFSVMPVYCCSTCSDAGTQVLVLMHLLEHVAGCVRQSLLRLRVFRWHVCTCVQILSGLLTG